MTKGGTLNRPILDPEWVQEKLIDSGLFSLPESREKSPENTTREICLAALETWGAEKQTRMVFEEVAELQKELCKNARGKDNREAIAEEIADVEVMLEQMKILHGVEELSTVMKAQKLERLAKRILEAKQKPELPELAQYDSEHILHIPLADEERTNLSSTAVYEVVFDADHSGKSRYYCFIEAANMMEAVGIFFREHPHVTYDMVVDHTEIA